MKASTLISALLFASLAAANPVPVSMVPVDLSLAVESVDGNSLKSGTVDGSAITDGSIHGTDIADDTIDGEKLVGKSVTNAEVENKVFFGVVDADGTLSASSAYSGAGDNGLVTSLACSYSSTQCTSNSSGEGADDVTTTQYTIKFTAGGVSDEPVVTVTPLSMVSCFLQDVTVNPATLKATATIECDQNTAFSFIAVSNVNDNTFWSSP